MQIDGAAFRQLGSISLADSQSRFLPQTSLEAPFAVSGTLTAPGDALFNSQLQFTATAMDASGIRRIATASTTIVAGGPAAGDTEVTQAAEFPSVVVRVPREALPNQQVTASASAPAARIDLDRPLPAGVTASDVLLLVKAISIAGEDRLQIVDRFGVTSAGEARIRTAGIELPGLTESGDYAIVALPQPDSFVTGRATGPQSIVLADGSPFVFLTAGANSHAIPVSADSAFTLRILNVDGTATAPLPGRRRQPAPWTSDSRWRRPLVCSPPLPSRRTGRSSASPRRSCSASRRPVDPRFVAASIVVVDEAGSRVFGTTTTSSDGLSAAFAPSRRWKLGARYR